jgi:peptidyl-prolyl cis-trans isomerase B (cyclophilin B)
MFIEIGPPINPQSSFMSEAKPIALVKELRGCGMSIGSINISPLRGYSLRNVPVVTRFVVTIVSVTFILGASTAIWAQNPTPSADSPKKVNTRPADAKPAQSEPFAGASIEKMSGQCVTLDTEQGAIAIEMFPAKAPETVRSFLNLVAAGALDTTVFSRTVKGFAIQGGNLATSENWSATLAARMERRLPDEPSDVRHVRGIVSMARTDEPNSASTHFFILVGDGPHLDGKFAAFGRVVRGIEIADAINRAEAAGDKPLVPVRIKRATVAVCEK